MLSPGPATKVYLAAGATDLRAGAEQLFFCKFFVSVRAGSGDGEKFLEFQREWVVLGRER